MKKRGKKLSLKVSIVISDEGMKFALEGGGQQRKIINWS
jgi:hypothetical protein